LNQNANKVEGLPSSLKSEIITKTVETKKPKDQLTMKFIIIKPKKTTVAMKNTSNTETDIDDDGASGESDDTENEDDEEEASTTGIKTKVDHIKSIVSPKNNKATLRNTSAIESDTDGSESGDSDFNNDDNQYDEDEEAKISSTKLSNAGTPSVVREKSLSNDDIKFIVKPKEKFMTLTNFSTIDSDFNDMGSGESDFSDSQKEFNTDETSGENIPIENDNSMEDSKKYNVELRNISTSEAAFNDMGSGDTDFNNIGSGEADFSDGQKEFNDEEAKRSSTDLSNDETSGDMKENIPSENDINSIDSPKKSNVELKNTSSIDPDFNDMGSGDAGFNDGQNVDETSGDMKGNIPSENDINPEEGSKKYNVELRNISTSEAALDDIGSGDTDFNNIGSGEADFSNGQKEFNDEEAKRSSTDLSNDETSGDIKQNIPSGTDINFFVKPKENHMALKNISTTESDFIDGGDEGAGINNIEKEVEENVKSKRSSLKTSKEFKQKVGTVNGISTYIVGDNTDGGGGGESGSGNVEESGSGSGVNGVTKTKILTYVLKAVAHPLRIKNETKLKAFRNGTSAKTRVRRHIPSKFHQKSLKKKTFVPASEMFIPDKGDIQDPHQISSLFYKTLHPDYHARPQFGSQSDPWSETDISNLLSISGNKGVNFNHPLKPRGRGLDSRAETRQMGRQMGRSPAMSMMYHEPRRQFRHHKVPLGEQIPQGAEGQVIAANFREATRGVGNDDEDVPQDDVSIVEAPMNRKGAVQFTPAAMIAQQIPQQIPAQAAARMIPMRIKSPIKSPQMNTMTASQRAKLADTKAGEDEMVTAEAKFEAMERVKMQQELIRRKGDFNLNLEMGGQATEQEQKSIKSYFGDHARKKKRKRTLAHHKSFHAARQ